MSVCLGISSSILLLWSDVCSWCWGVFLGCSKKMDPVFPSILLVCVFLLGNWDHWCWEISMSSYFLVVVFVVVVVCVYVCVFPLFWLASLGLIFTTLLIKTEIKCNFIAPLCFLSLMKCSWPNMFAISLSPISTINLHLFSYLSSWCLVSLKI